MNSTRTHRRRHLLVPGLLLTAMGVAFLAPGVWIARDLYTVATTWPETEAIADGSRVQEGFGEKGRRIFRAEYELRYTANGREYLVPFSSPTSYSSLASAQEDAAAYAPGTRHGLRYDEARPWDARPGAGLRAGFFAMPLVFCTAGLILLAVGVFLLQRSRVVRHFQCPHCGGECEEGWRCCAGCGGTVGKKPFGRGGAGFGTSRKEQKRQEKWLKKAAGRRGLEKAQTIMGGVFALVGAGLLTAAAVIGLQGYEMLEVWPETEGVVTGGTVIERHNREAVRRFAPRIEFRYQAAGQEHTGVAGGGTGADYVWARDQIEKYAPGSRHPVRYNPENPSEASYAEAAQIEMVTLPGIFAAMGLMFGGIGAGILRSAFIWKKKHCMACGAGIGKSYRHCTLCGHRLDAPVSWA